MSDDTGPISSNTDDFTGKYTSKILYASYVIMLAFSLIIFTYGLFNNSIIEAFIAVPVIFILVDTLFVERINVHIPPLFIFMMVGLMMFILLGRMFEEGYLFGLIADLLFGMVMGLGGLILTYSLMRAAPGINDKRPFITAFVSMSMAVSMFTILLMIQYYVGLLTGSEIETTGDIMNKLIMVVAGAMAISVMFYFGKHSAIMKKAFTKYLENRAGILDIDEYEMMEIKKAIKGGENEKVEYKSTLRTNLSTGEKDTRMEKSVLKTIVAFLNSNGGTLLIGVADDGTIIGIDEASFDNRDKLNLHLTNLIASQIGNEYLPFISFRLTDYDGKGVMRIACKKSDSPVFLKEGKQETFYVRSGPSSVDLHGMDTLNYVDNRFTKGRKRKVV